MCVQCSSNAFQLRNTESRKDRASTSFRPERDKRRPPRGREERFRAAHLSQQPRGGPARAKSRPYSTRSKRNMKFSYGEVGTESGMPMSMSASAE